MRAADLAIASQELSDAIRPLLAGKPAGVQGAALADLLAIWLAGHLFPGDPGATADLRQQMLNMHCGKVRELVALEDQRRAAAAPQEALKR